MKSVLLIHTGGTLGMGRQTGAPLEPGQFTEKILERIPEVAKLARIDTKVLYNLDSSDIGPAQWTVLADEIGRAQKDYDGFVVIHGTDTMAYTAAALSFALMGLDRPVILTGSQRPLEEVRTDARRNVVDAVDLATRTIPEVGICFDGKLWRGNRATKGDSWTYAAFVSPGFEPLARLGVDVVMGEEIRKPDRPFSVESKFSKQVAVCHVTPGMSGDVLLQIGEAAQGIVLAAFGVGTVPTVDQTIRPALERLIAKQRTVLIVTQARAGTVSLPLYQNSRWLADIGAISGGDMTIEAATAKLMHALAKFPDDLGARANYLLANVAGERTAALT